MDKKTRTKASQFHETWMHLRWFPKRGFTVIVFALGVKFVNIVAWAYHPAINAVHANA